MKEYQFEIVRTCNADGFSSDAQSYLKTSDVNYSKVKSDFKYLPEFQAIECLHFENSFSNKVFIHANDLETGLYAANYIAKKMIEEDKLFDSRAKRQQSSLLKQHVEEGTSLEKELMSNITEEDEVLYADLLSVLDHPDKQQSDEDFDFIDEFDDFSFDFDTEHEQQIVNLSIYEFPMIDEQEFLSKYMNTHHNYFLDIEERVNDKQDFVLFNEQRKVWYDASPTIIVLLEQFNLDAWIKVIPFIHQNIIFVTANQKDANDMYQKLQFVEDVPALALTTIDKAYLLKIFSQVIKKEGVKVARSFSFQQMLVALENFKQSELEPLQDVLYLAKRFVSYCKKSGEPLSNQVTEKLLNSKRVELKAQQKIRNLIGLEEPKEALKKIKAKLKFNEARSKLNLPQLDNHYVMAFIGHPGTAKTTFAKLMAEDLIENGLLKGNRFVIATKKDLIGQYVGHTTLKVANLFKQVRNGVLFIDEAYSLYEGTNSTVFAEEAMAEIVVQIEENPATVVIFAGYPEEMERFMDSANAGLKSRISHKIHFTDYTVNEMCDIYVAFVKNNHFELEHMQAHYQLIQQFLRKLTVEQLRKEGNGRFMRKLFQRVVEEKIHAAPENQLITVHHLTTALTNLSKEMYGAHTAKMKQIGFK